MAKHKGSGRGRFRRYLKGSVDHTLALSTLAAKTLISSNLASSVNERTFCSSLRATWSLNSMTRGSDDGPILVGVAHSDYTSIEIEEWIEQSNSWNEGNLIGQEIAKRKIRRVGLFETPDDALEAIVLNDGKPITTKLGWILLQAQTLKVWAYNTGISALATTDPDVQVNGHANLWPK